MHIQQHSVIAPPPSGADGITDIDQTVTSTSQLTFIGLESVPLHDKTFSNVCHFRNVILTQTINGITNDLPTTDSNGEKIYSDQWVAPGYGPIKELSHDGNGDHITSQYAGDLPS
jgi:hypothetical protein